MPKKSIPDDISKDIEEFTHVSEVASQEPEPKNLKELESILRNRGFKEREKKEYTTGKGDNIKVKKPRLTPLEVASVLKEYISFVVIDDISNPVNLFLLDQGIYTDEEAYFFKFISCVENTLSESQARTVIFHLKNEAPIKKRYTGDNYACVGNGLFNFNTKELEPYRPDVVFTSKIATDYKEFDSEPSRDGWTFSAMLKEWANGDDELESVLWQIIRASVQLKNREQFVLFRDSGTGRTGKGTAQEFISSLVGKSNVLPLTMKELTKDHQTEGIEKAQVIIGDDNDAKAFLDEPRVIKSLATGDPININPKKMKRYSFQGTPLIIQSINGHLKTSDMSNAFKRRMLIVPFIRSYKGSKGNPKIKNEYAHDEEILQYILYEALQLEDFTLFIQPEISKKILHEFTLENDVVADFYENVFKQFQSARLRVDFVYNYFVRWAGSVGKPSKVSQRMFVSRLNEFIADSDEWEHTGQTALQVLDYFLEEDNLVDDRPFLDELTYIQESYRRKRKSCYVNKKREHEIELKAIDVEIRKLEETSEAIENGRGNMKMLDLDSHNKQLKEMKQYRDDFMQSYS
ncbi:DNA primase family protein [Alkalibacterium olivapovliticus]|uniref:Putative DNA primase/helicase n=1 Tax=Alkalibacterium olivapovliticus TaxID=99907 RepID=A0A2T0W5K0_9LACT|nr:DNA primase family protein [Alkalibacterium olivapovliticus]PRY81009.1 putative DNA primase/helicase [Alkalibacterium olivapovliticus]